MGYSEGARQGAAEGACQGRNHGRSPEQAGRPSGKHGKRNRLPEAAKGKCGRNRNPGIRASFALSPDGRRKGCGDRGQLRSGGKDPKVGRPSRCSGERPLTGSPAKAGSTFTTSISQSASLLNSFFKWTDIPFRLGSRGALACRRQPVHFGSRSAGKQRDCALKAGRLAMAGGRSELLFLLHQLPEIPGEDPVCRAVGLRVGL